MEPAIHIRKISKTYRNEVRALCGLTIRVEPGEVFGLLGPNGAGKSTLVKSLLGLVRPTACDGAMLGRPIGHKATLKRVGYLPEHVQYAGHLTPVDLLELAGKLTEVSLADRKQRTGQLLATVGMDRWQQARLSTFSKGMKQRVALAQALINDPDLIFLDEPTDGVDPVGRREIRELILRLKARGKTIFVNSHLLGELEMICDRVAILCQGRVMRQGRLEELTRHGQRYDVVVEGNLLEEQGLVSLVRTLGGTMAATESECRTMITIPTGRPQVVQPVIDELRSLCKVVVSVSPAKQSLEELFMDVVLKGGTSEEILADPEAKTIMAP